VIGLASVPTLRGLAPIPYEKEYYELSEEVVTPHIPWAKPCDGGRVRALFIAPRYCQRHTVEMAQRLDLDYDVVSTTTRTQLGLDVNKVKSYCLVKGLFQDEVEGVLRAKLQADHDVIVIGTFWRTLPLWSVYEILKKVDAGAGLLIGCRQKGGYLDQVMAIGTDEDPGAVAAGVPAAEIANLSGFEGGNPLLAASSLGRGRVLMLNYPRNPVSREYVTPDEAAPATQQDYEYYQSLAIRALLWCARRDPIVDLTPRETGQWDLAAPPAAVTLELNAAKKIWRAGVEVVWRDRQGCVLVTPEPVFLRLAAGRNAVDVPAPELPAGTAFADVRVLRDGRVCGWGSLAFEVRSELRIQELTFAKELFGAGEPAVFSVALSVSAPAACELRASVVDVHGRVLTQASVPVPAGADKATYALDLPPPLAVWHRLDATLVVAGKTVQHAQREFHREWRRPEDAFTLVGWYGPAKEGWIDRLIARRSAASGLDTVYLSHFWKPDADRRAVESARAGLTILPYVCYVGLGHHESYDKRVREPCLSDPGYRDRLLTQVSDCARKLRKFCPAGYSLGDENYYAPWGGTEYCASPHCVREFRAWLKNKYGDVEAMNRAWGAALGGFDEAGHIAVDDARKQGNPAPWIDFRLCMEDVWSGTFAALTHGIAKLDPLARCGHEGSGRIDSFQAFNWWTMLRDLSLFVPYPGRPVGGEMVRSFAKRGTMSAYWYGAYTFSCGGRRLATQRYFPWFCLFQGYNSSWYFNTHGHGGMSHEVGFAADLRALPHFQATADACRRIKTGFDKLLLNSARQTDGIAVYFSASSVHENTFHKRRVRHMDEFEGFCKVLEDLSLQYDFVSYEQVAAGVLTERKYGLLVMPLVQAVSAAEAKAVRAFVEAGGALLADLPPALADALGRAHDPQPLAGLFGAQPKPEDLRQVPAVQVLERNVRYALNLAAAEHPADVWMLDAPRDAALALKHAGELLVVEQRLEHAFDGYRLTGRSKRQRDLGHPADRDLPEDSVLTKPFKHPSHLWCKTPRHRFIVAAAQ